MQYQDWDTIVQKKDTVSNRSPSGAGERGEEAQDARGIGEGQGEGLRSDNLRCSLDTTGGDCVSIPICPIPPFSVLPTHFVSEKVTVCMYFGIGVR